MFSFLKCDYFIYKRKQISHRILQSYHFLHFTNGISRGFHALRKKNNKKDYNR